MTTLTERPNTALVVIDVQNDVVAGGHNRDGVIANIAFLVDKARAENVPPGRHAGTVSTGSVSFG